MAGFFERFFKRNRPAAPQPSCPVRSTGGRSAGERRVVVIAGIEVGFRWRPPGRFMMGDPYLDYEDAPVHEVTLTRGFWLAETPTTQELWEAVVGENDSCIQRNLQFPAKVYWEEANEFVQSLNAYDDNPSVKFRLPTEAEWEYACRAGWPEENYFEKGLGANDDPFAVKEKPVGCWGLYCMVGNGAEFCSDWYGDYPLYAVTDPKGPDRGEYHVARGFGFWNPYPPGDYASACADSAIRDSAEGVQGFRILMTDCN